MASPAACRQCLAPPPRISPQPRRVPSSISRGYGPKETITAAKKKPARIHEPIVDWARIPPRRRRRRKCAPGGAAVEMLYTYRTDKDQILDLESLGPFGMTTEIWKSAGLYNQPGGASDARAIRASKCPQPRWNWVVGNCRNLSEFRFKKTPAGYLVYTSSRRVLWGCAMPGTTI